MNNYVNVTGTKNPTLGGLFCLFIKNEFGARYWTRTSDTLHVMQVL